MFCRRRHLVVRANLLSAVSSHDALRLLQPSLHMLTRCLVVSGHPPLDEFRTLMINPSAELVESFQASRSRTWRRSREHQLSAHTADSSRLVSRLSCLTNILIISSQCRLISIFPSRLTAVPPSSSTQAVCVLSTASVSVVSLFALHCWAAAAVHSISGSVGAWLPLLGFDSFFLMSHRIL